jgi:hypothetical protein
MSNYTERLNAIMAKQSAKGMKTYKVSLEDSDLNAIDAIDYLLEEQLDSMMYMLKLRDRLIESGYNDETRDNG